MNDVASTCQLCRMTACPASRIEEFGAREDAPLDQPGNHCRALFTDRTINQQVEGPRVLGIERAADIVVHVGESSLRALRKSGSLPVVGCRAALGSAEFLEDRVILPVKEKVDQLFDVRSHHALSGMHS
jgi:hypothetical protein